MKTAWRASILHCMDDPGEAGIPVFTEALERERIHAEVVNYFNQQGGSKYIGPGEIHGYLNDIEASNIRVRVQSGKQIRVQLITATQLESLMQESVNGFKETEVDFEKLETEEY